MTDGSAGGSGPREGAGSRIRKLPPELVDRIAAGEVVERPASVVKELVENSLDAGATDVTVEIRAGGTDLIVIRDDGCGIGAGDLPLAFASHATSKLSALEDLDHIASFGFRGEALASIGAVADARIVSREHTSPHGHEIESRGGDVSEVKPVAAAPGTVVEVRNLFKYVPARRKFLRSPASESAQVTEAVEKAALANPAVAFTLIRDGKTVFRAGRQDGRDVRIPRFHGKELAGMLLAVGSRDGDLSVEGYVARPEASRPTAALQHFFLNGRPIRDRTLQHALRQAFEGLLMKGKWPVAFLFISMDPADVDVNVHPSKAEVRFRHPDRLHRLVHGAVRQALLAADLKPAVEFTAPAPGAAPMARPAAGTPSGYLESVQDALAGFLASPRAERREDEGDRRWNAPSSAEQRSTQPAPRGGPTYVDVAPPRPVGRYLQIRNTFLVYETGDGIEIVDQHALHERIRLEEIHERLHESGTIEVQRLLSPRVIELPAADVERLTGAAEMLAKLGLEVGPFGPTAVGLHAIPLLFGRRDPAPFLRDVADRLRERGDTGDREEMLESILHSMACRSAVMAGDPLTEEQIADLLRRAGTVDTSQGCAHGRPTALRVSFGELERRFGRAGA